MMVPATELDLNSEMSFVEPYQSFPILWEPILWETRFVEPIV